MKILGTLFGIVLGVAGFGLIVQGRFSRWGSRRESRIFWKRWLGVLLLTGMGIAMAVYQARQNELIDRLWQEELVGPGGGALQCAPVPVTGPGAQVPLFLRW